MRKPLHALLAAAALALGLALVPSPALAAPAESDGILVTLTQPGAGEISLLSDARSTLDAAGIEAGEVVTSGDGSLTLAARPADGQTDEQALAAALELPGVTDAQLNYVYQIIEPVTDDAGAGATDGIAPQAGTLREAIRANDPYAQVADPDESRNQYWLYNTSLVDAWNIARASNAVTVALFDSGVTLDHPDLEANLLTDLAWDSYYKRPLTETQMESGTTDNGGHGTMVAGVIAGVANNQTGIAGASYNANILPVKVVNDSNGNTNTEALARAFTYLLDLIDEGKVTNVRVVNMSLGGYGDSFSGDELLHSLIREARSSYDILSVCAGGNGKSGEPLTEPCYPGDYEECVSVTALEPDGTNIPWSDYNKSKDISAPGRNVLTTSAGGGYGTASGSSLAAPMVSGTVALMCYAEPCATADELVEALESTAVPVEDPDNDRTGTSGSHGALDAEAAVQYLKDHVTRFTDVHEYDWFYSSVMFVGQNGIMNGYDTGKGLFGVADSLQRQDAAGLLYNYLGNGETASAHCGLSDVPESAYYTNAVNWCVENDIFHGYPDGRFGVGDNITRQDFLCVIYNWAHKEGDVVDESIFYARPDYASTGSYAVDAVKWCLSKGVVSGSLQADGTRWILPTSNVSRSEVAGIISNAINGKVL